MKLRFNWAKIPDISVLNWDLKFVLLQLIKLKLVVWLIL